MAANAPYLPLRVPESPGIPQCTGSHPPDFAPAPFATRPTPSYPQRAGYANFDPVFRHQAFATAPVGLGSSHTHLTSSTPAPIERRAGSEPHTGWLRQNVEVDTRRISVPSALEAASLTFRQTLPYLDRTMDEITAFMPPPIVETRRNRSLPVTDEEAFAAWPSERPNDWSYAWRDENAPKETLWVGHDNSRFAMFGGIDDPNETAAVPNDNILESIEAQSDPLIALRQVANQSQTLRRRELERQILMEDSIRSWAGRFQAAERNNRNLAKSIGEARDQLALATSERDLLRSERDIATRRAERLLQNHDHPEEERLRKRAKEGEYENAIFRARGLEDRIRTLLRSEAGLMAELDSATTRADRLQRQRDELEYRADGLELERDHFETERDRERDQNQHLQAQVHSLTRRLPAAQALAVPPLVVPAANSPATVPQPVVQPTDAHTPAAAAAGTARGSGRGRGRSGARGRRGRGGRGAAPPTREQPGRRSKVGKNYKI